MTIPWTHPETSYATFGLISPTAEAASSFQETDVKKYILNGTNFKNIKNIIYKNFTNCINDKNIAKYVIDHLTEDNKNILLHFSDYSIEKKIEIILYEYLNKLFAQLDKKNSAILLLYFFNDLNIETLWSQQYNIKDNLEIIYLLGSNYENKICKKNITQIAELLKKSNHDNEYAVILRNLFNFYDNFATTKECFGFFLNRKLNLQEKNTLSLSYFLNDILDLHNDTLDIKAKEENQRPLINFEIVLCGNNLQSIIDINLEESFKKSIFFGIRFSRLVSLTAGITRLSIKNRIIQIHRTASRSYFSK